MDEDEARRRFAAGRVGRLATVTPQGGPHVVPVVFALVDDVAYTAVDGKPKTTNRLQRVANVAATGRAGLLVDEYAEDWTSLWWVRFDGSAEVLAAGSGEASSAVDALTRKYSQYLGDPPPGPVIAVRLAMWRSWEATPVP
ncbi:MAG: TIGR03668 family PPOX class F420-dependent oxidoreductase [Dermatophilaceae bacterium]